MPQQSHIHHTSLSSPLLMLSRCTLVQYLSKRGAWLLCCLYQPPPQLNILNQNNMKKHGMLCLAEEINIFSAFLLPQHARRDHLLFATLLTQPTLPISAFQITWFYCSVFLPVVQNLLRNTCRKTIDNKS